MSESKVPHILNFSSTWEGNSGYPSSMKPMILPGIKPLSSTWLLNCATNDGLYLKLYGQSAL
jgi:hypothetical protein